MRKLLSVAPAIAVVAVLTVADGSVRAQGPDAAYYYSAPAYRYSYGGYYAYSYPRAYSYSYSYAPAYGYAPGYGYAPVNGYDLAYARSLPLPPIVHFQAANYNYNYYNYGYNARGWSAWDQWARMHGYAQ
jgi:hypothetical protein